MATTCTLKKAANTSKRSSRLVAILTSSIAKHDLLHWNVCLFTVHCREIKHFSWFNHCKEKYKLIRAMGMLYRYILHCVCNDTYLPLSTFSIDNVIVLLISIFESTVE